MPNGRVYLVGAGPGDPGLITLRGLSCLRQADAVVYDRLVHQSLLSHVKATAELVYAGKATGVHTMSQDEINRTLIELAGRHRAVVRLKGGDPFVFGRGGEEAEALAAENIPFEIIPGVTASIAVPAYAGIPVTHRGLASSLAIITGHDASQIPWEAAAGLDTAVFMMGRENLPVIAAELIEHGRSPETPVAVVGSGTRSEQKTVIGTLADIAEKDLPAAPVVTVVGSVVKMRKVLRWFDNRPLFGKRMLITRASEQSETFAELLRSEGAEPVLLPVIKVAPPQSFTVLDAALKRMREYDWLVFTSANGVTATLDRLLATGGDIRSLYGPKIAAIGPKTADALAKLDIRVDFVPSEYRGEAVADEFPEVSGKRILITRAEKAREVLPERLTEAGARVDVVAAYSTKFETPPPVENIDYVTFTSPSTIEGFLRVMPVPPGAKVACIGPVTAEAARERGIAVDVVATEYTVEGLVAAIIGRDA